MSQQLHKRFTDGHVKIILQWYCDKELTLEDALARLECKEAQFFRILKQYRDSPDTFTIAYPKRSTHNRLPDSVDSVIKEELKKEKVLIENKDMPIRDYNYTAVRDEVAKRIEGTISSQTVRNRAHDWGYDIPKRERKKTYDREVTTTAVGQLFQHDSSHHLWSPFAKEKWSLIDTIDDYSRLLLFGRLFKDETTWAHLQATEAVILNHGVGLAYYADSLRVFRYVCHQDSTWVHQIKGTDEVATQWKRAVGLCGMKVWYATSAQAKGKIERPYRWLQDRLVRRCAKEGIKHIDDANTILQEEMKRYNEHTVHSTTKEIPMIRYQKAIDNGITVCKPLQLPAPYTSTKDIFCLTDTRKVGAYRKLSWRKYVIDIPKNISIGAEIELHIIPDDEFPEVRLWHKNKIFKVVRLHKNQKK